MKDFLNPWVIAGTVLTASVLIALSFLAAGWLTSAPPEAYQGGAVITVIPVPTATPTPRPTATEIPLISPTPDTVNGIQLGGYVQISGTGGDGLRLRSEPSLNGEIVYLGLEGEIFQVKGGPEDRDGYLWWQLEAPLNPNRQGWAVSDFLKFAQNP
ncbi:MAG: SH3 domain-containing protein [Anaerolineales bacterium]